MNIDQSSHPLADRTARPDGSCVRVGPVDIGSQTFAVISGPCAVENEAQLERAARMVTAAGVPLLRGGAFKPRTSPYSFQGLGEHGLRLLDDVGRGANLPVVTEVMSIEQVGVVARYADVLQVGARNMHNFALLKALGDIGKPVLLKRGLAATVEEWLCAAEYILQAGNPDVILCERGIRTFETSTRNTLDLNSVALLKTLTHLPVLVDPSHGTGRHELVKPLALAALAAGADGVIVEAHPEPDAAWSDGAQSLDGAELESLMQSLGRLAPAFGRRLATATPTPLAPRIAAYQRRIDAIDDSLAALLEERVRLEGLVEPARTEAGGLVRAGNRKYAVLNPMGDDAPIVATTGAFHSIIGERRPSEEKCNAA